MKEYNKENIKFAKELRKNMTPWERKLWYKFLRKYKVRFQRQKAIGNYIADFYCAKAKLIIVFVETLRVLYCAMHNTRLRITQTTKLLQSIVADKHKLVRGRIYSAKTVITVFYNIDYSRA